MKIVFISCNDMGAGHIRRTAAIIREIMSIDYSIDALIITNSTYISLLNRVNIPYIILPHILSAPRSKVGSDSSRITKTLYNSILLSTIRLYSPNAVVFDTYADIDVVKALKAQGVFCILVYRKCNESTALKLIRSGAFTFFDKIVIPHDCDEFSFNMDGRIFSHFESINNAIFTGPIVHAVKCEHKIASPSRFVLFMPGGGGYDAIQLDFFKRCSWAIYNTDPTLKCIFPCGPFSSHPTDFCHNTEYLYDEIELSEYIKKCQFVISHGGYNSVNEIIRYGAKVIFCSFYRKTEEQNNRVLFYKSRKGTIIVDESIDSLDLQYEIIKLIQAEQPECNHISGAAKAASIIFNQIASKQSKRIISLTLEEIQKCRLGDFIEPSILIVRIGNIHENLSNEEVDKCIDRLTSFGVEECDIELWYREDSEKLILPNLLQHFTKKNLRKIVGILQTQISQNILYVTFEACRNIKTSTRYDLISESNLCGL